MRWEATKRDGRKLKDIDLDTRYFYRQIARIDGGDFNVQRFLVGEWPLLFRQSATANLPSTLPELFSDFNTLTITPVVS